MAQAILEGIQAVESTVTPTVTSCDPQLSVTNSPASATVASGDTATFTETITVANGTAPGEYHCTVDYLVDGASQGFVENTTVHVRGLAVNDVTVDEGAGNATFTVTLLGGPSPTPVTVNVATTNGTATAPADYAATNGTVTFGPGETSRPVPVPVVQDAVDEPNETFTLNLSAPSTGVGIVDGQGVATIVDDDRDGTFSCTATAANVAGITAAVAKPANLPCVDDSRTVASISLNAGLINVSSSALTARTDLTPDDQSLPPAAGDRAESTARVDRTTISTLGLAIELGVIQSQAAVSCVAGPGCLTSHFTGSSNIASLRINGVPVTVGSAPLTIPLVIGSLKLNSTTIANGVVTQEAVALEAPLARIVLAKSQADVHGTPPTRADRPAPARKRLTVGGPSPPSIRGRALNAQNPDAGGVRARDGCRLRGGPVGGAGLLDRWSYATCGPTGSAFVAAGWPSTAATAAGTGGFVCFAGHRASLRT